MAFSKRIRILASLVEPNKNIVDIGCDHALLDIYLSLYNHNSCIATDINEKAIQHAKENIKKYNLEMPVYVSDGLKNIPLLEDTTGIIAGMGTNTIIQILQNQDLNQLSSFVIQTNNDYYLLRKFMTSIGYQIEEEITFYDKGVRYIVIKFIKGIQNYSYFELILGPKLMQKKDKETILYFQERYQENKKIEKKLPIRHWKKKLQYKLENRTIKKLLRNSF